MNEGQVNRSTGLVWESQGVVGKCTIYNNYCACMFFQYDCVQPTYRSIYTIHLPCIPHIHGIVMLCCLMLCYVPCVATLFHAEHTCGAGHSHFPPWINAKKGLAGSSDVLEYSGQFPGMQTPRPA